MDIPALSNSISNYNLGLQIGTAVLSINQDLMQQQGQALVTLLQSVGTSNGSLENSVTPYLGGNIDIKL